jgi:hypothetical protein
VPKALKHSPDKLLICRGDSNSRQRNSNRSVPIPWVTLPRAERRHGGTPRTDPRNNDTTQKIPFRRYAYPTPFLFTCISTSLWCEQLSFRCLVMIHDQVVK